MKRQLSPNVWRWVRGLLKGAQLGRDVRRFAKGRKELDLARLRFLVAEGLATAEPDAGPPAGRTEPAEFRAKYALTALGTAAAEFGEYVRPGLPTCPSTSC